MTAVFGKSPESKLNLFLSRLLLSAGSARRAPEEAGGDRDPRRRPEERGGARRARSGKEEVEPGELQGLRRPEPALERSAPRSPALRSRPSLVSAARTIPETGQGKLEASTTHPNLQVGRSERGVWSWGWSGVCVPECYTWEGSDDSWRCCPPSWESPSPGSSTRFNLGLPTGFSRPSRLQFAAL